MMFVRLTALCVLTLALTCTVASAQDQSVQPQQPYPPGAYQPAQSPLAQPQYPQAQPQYPQAQPQYPQQPYPQPGYPPAEAAPAYGPAPGAYPPGAYAPGYAPPGYPAPPEVLLTSVEGKLQLSLGTTFVRYRSSSIEAESLDIKVDRSELNWGFSDSSDVLLEGGYGITENLLLGGILQLGGESQTDDVNGMEAESSAFTFLIGPKVDYHFIPTSKWNPFVGAIIAINVGSATEGVLDTSSLLFNFLLRGGVRVFVNDSLSLDPAIVFGFVTGSGTQSGMGTAEVDLSLSGFQFGLSLGASYWL